MAQSNGRPSRLSNSNSNRNSNDGSQRTGTTDHVPSEITLLSLNCWGLKFISAQRTPRLAEIGRQIALLDPKPHIVCLQECWVQDDYRAIRAATCDILPHGKFYHSGAFGGGLAILSCWPLEESSMVPYNLNGRPTASWRGDWYVGKGVAKATVRFGPGKADIIEVFNTHTHAPYEKGPNDSYLCHRTAQAWEISKHLRAATERGNLVVALGDFNMVPQSLPYRIITARSLIRDTWRILHPDSSIGASDQDAEKARGVAVPTAEYNMRVNGAASDTVYNTWRWSKEERKKLKTDPCPVDPDTKDPRGKRIDYVLASTGDVSSGTGWVVKSAAVELTGRHPTLNCSLSDHFGVRATLQRHTLSASDAGDKATGHDIQLRYNQEHRDTLTLSDYDEMLSMTHKYMARERKERYWRFVRFYIAVAVWIGCLVAVWFSPRNFVAFLLMLLSTLGLTAGTVEGLLALLFFSGEIRALKEFEWEVQNARAIAVAAGTA